MGLAGVGRSGPADKFIGVRLAVPCSLLAAEDCVSRRSPFVVELSPEDRAVLEERAASRSVAHAVVVRARIVLLAADGLQNVVIAERVGVCVDVASRWRKRFCEEGLDGLGGPPSVGATTAVRA